MGSLCPHFGQLGTYLWFSLRTNPFRKTKCSQKPDIFKITNAFQARGACPRTPLAYDVDVPPPVSERVYCTGSGECLALGNTRRDLKVKGFFFRGGGGGGGEVEEFSRLNLNPNPVQDTNMSILLPCLKVCDIENPKSDTLTGERPLLEIHGTMGVPTPRGRGGSAHATAIARDPGPTSRRTHLDAKPEAIDGATLFRSCFWY